MHEIEPYFNWRHLYTAEEDPQSPFYKRTYSEFEFSQTVYNYYIHPQWDDFGSRTLYLKILFTDYELPITTKSERFMFMVELKNEAAVAATVEVSATLTASARTRAL